MKSQAFLKNSSKMLLNPDNSWTESMHACNHVSWYCLVKGQHTITLLLTLMLSGWWLDLMLARLRQWLQDLRDTGSCSCTRRRMHVKKSMLVFVTLIISPCPFCPPHKRRSLYSAPGGFILGLGICLR